CFLGVERSIERHDFKAVAFQLGHLFRREAKALGKFIAGGGATQFGTERVVEAGELAEALRTPDWDADGTSLFGDGAMDALLDPNRRVRGEFRAKLWIVQLGG